MIASLGYRTDLFFSRLSGEVVDRGEYICVRTPTNPTFWWGNYVLFKRAPEKDDSSHWLEVFSAEHPDAQHIAIGFDSTEAGDVSDFPLTLQTSSVMTAQAVNEPPHPSRKAELRPLLSDADWDARLALSRAVHTWGGEFMERSNLARREQVRAGHGQFFGAFLDGQLVSSLGIFNTGDGLGRFQSVETHPEFERRGLCGTLTQFAGQYAFEKLDVQTLVIVADPEYHAQRIYESVGFKVTEMQFALEKPDAPT
jgi:RimJ/RimL family protein N-acetyltransferase